jgi:hypothetical protein
MIRSRVHMLQETTEHHPGFHTACTSQWSGSLVAGTPTRCSCPWCSGGLGQIDHRHLEKADPEISMLVVKIGGPAYRIGMGGGAASSLPSGSNNAELDFNAVQVRKHPATDLVTSNGMLNVNPC